MAPMTKTRAINMPIFFTMMLNFIVLVFYLLLFVVYSTSSPVSGVIGCFRQLVEKIKERLRLTDEQSIRGQGIERGHCSSVGLGRTNDRDDRERAAKENGGFGHD